jgi:hypothetical protein
MERPLHEYATAKLPITFICVGCQRPIAVSRLEGHVLMNFVSSIQQFLAPALVNRMAASLGLGQGLASKAIQVAVPAILAGLARGTSKPIVVNQLARVLARQDSSLIRNYSSVIGSSSQQPLIEGGINALGAVFGSTSTSALTSAIGKYTGLNFNQSESLLGMIVPVVLGQLAQTQKSEGVDTEGLAQLIDAQKDSITAAIPNGFAKLLETTGLIEPIAKDTAEAASNEPALEVPGDELPAPDMVDDTPKDIETAAISEPTPTFETQPVHDPILDTSELIPPRPALPMGALADHDEEPVELPTEDNTTDIRPLAEEPGVTEPIVSNAGMVAEEDTVTEPSIAATLLPGTELKSSPESSETKQPFTESYSWSPDVPPSVETTVQPEGIDYDPPVVASPTVDVDAGPATSLPKETSEPLVITPTTISRPSVEATLLETAPSRASTQEPEPERIATSRAEIVETAPPAPQRVVAPEPPPEAKPAPAQTVAPPATSSSVPPIPAPKPASPPNLPPVSQVAHTAIVTPDDHEKPAQEPRRVSPVWPEEPRPSRALGVLKRFVVASIVLGAIGFGGYALHDHVTKLQATQSAAPTAPAEATVPAEPAPVAAPAPEPTPEPTPAPAVAPSTPPTDAAPEPAATPPSPEPEAQPSEATATPEATPAPTAEPATPDATASEPAAAETPSAAPEAAAPEASTDAPAPSSDPAPASPSEPAATEPTATPSESLAPAAEPATAPASEPEASAPTAADNKVVTTATSLLDSLSATLAGITDEASATSALPSLEANAREIEALKTSADALTPEQRQPLAALITETLPKLMKSIDTASQTSSSVNDIIKPVLDPMFANLDAMSKS